MKSKCKCVDLIKWHATCVDAGRYAKQKKLNQIFDLKNKKKQKWPTFASTLVNKKERAKKRVKPSWEGRGELKPVFSLIYSLSLYKTGHVGHRRCRFCEYRDKKMMLGDKRLGASNLGSF